MTAVVREARRLWGSAQFQLQERGAAGLAGDALDLAVSYLTWPAAKRRQAGETFEIGGRRIEYFRHHYNRAWRNERSVELALAFDFLARHPAGRLLEVGNVLSHYGRTGHQILDKYEMSPGVLNIDVVDLAPEDPYDAIVSISTLEHVGWDERPRDRDKTIRAYQAIRAAAAPEAPVLLTCPIGQNAYLDEHIAEGRIDFPEIHYLKRISKSNQWVEVDLDDVRGARYGSPYRNANALFVGSVNW